MNARLFATALAAVLFAAGAQAQAPMAGMDMGGMKVPPTAKPSSLSVTATVTPAAPRTGGNALDLTVLDAGGKPVTGLKLTATVAMTSMDMGTAHPAVTEQGGGHYAVKVAFGMDGLWRVTVRNGASRLAALDFQAGAKTPWKSPQIKAAVATEAPAAKATPGRGGMAGMDMSAKPDAPAKPDSTGGNMAGMDIGGKSGGAGMVDTKAGVADMKTATVPQLQEQGTYTATGDEDWKAQTGFGHNAGMVGMMNGMMVGGSGMEGMKMPPMKMNFGPQNFAKPDPSDAAGGMPGMDMGGGNKAAPGGMAGMDMGAKPGGTGSVKTDAAPAGGITGGNAAASPAPVTITATTAAAPRAGDNPLTISVTDAAGKPVTGAAVTTTVAMTSMDMGTTHPAVKETGGGRYASAVAFSMAGPWRVTVRVTPPGGKPQTRAFDFTAK